MPKFFVDFQDGEVIHPDEEGSDVAGFEQAMVQTIGMLLQIAKDELPDGEHRNFAATVRDESGVALYRAKLTFCGEVLERPLSLRVPRST